MGADLTCRRETAGCVTAEVEHVSSVWATMGKMFGVVVGQQCGKITTTQNGLIFVEPLSTFKGTIYLY
jgi:hypothetical protein